MQNTPRVANPRRLAVIGGVVLVLSLVVLFSARDVIREVIVLPLSYVFWSIGVFLDTTPQLFFWVAALLLTGLAAYRSIAGRGRVVAEALPDLDGNMPAHSLHGQVSFWAARVNLLRQGQSHYFQNSFHHAVGRLLMDTLTYRFHLTAPQIEEQLREGSLGVPAEVRDYLLASLRRDDTGPMSVWTRYWSALVELFRSFFAPSQAGAGERSSAEEQQVQVVLKYIEDELEVPHDDTGR